MCEELFLWAGEQLRNCLISPCDAIAEVVVIVKCMYWDFYVFVVPPKVGKSIRG